MAGANSSEKGWTLGSQGARMAALFDLQRGGHDIKRVAVLVGLYEVQQAIVLEHSVHVTPPMWVNAESQDVGNSSPLFEISQSADSQRGV
ncbi:jg21805 [Pararge aegeria aegeria]|uniref:Jg21805 protein n=1 Tax=Pararge aegeria aegeria TaxID=348720 RepID=A0A8S4QL22_9NEOP|nr:jg21805 [Pararge aegeria aegeria]